MSEEYRLDVVDSLSVVLNYLRVERGGVDSGVQLVEDHL